MAEHCWHREPQGCFIYHGGVNPSPPDFTEICCQCGERRQITHQFAPPLGHGRHHKEWHQVIQIIETDCVPK
jgi:hypothetical protein